MLIQLASKGAAGSSSVVLAATLRSVGTSPPASIMLTFDADKFTSEYRAPTNVCGNTLTSVFVAERQGSQDAAP